MQLLCSLSTPSLPLELPPLALPSDFLFHHCNAVIRLILVMSFTIGRKAPSQSPIFTWTMPPIRYVASVYINNKQVYFPSCASPCQTFSAAFLKHWQSCWFTGNLWISLNCSIWKCIFPCFISLLLSIYALFDPIKKFVRRKCACVYVNVCDDDVESGGGMARRLVDWF